MLYIHETLKIHLSKYDKFNFIVSSLYQNLFNRYGPDFNLTTDIEDRFWTLFDLHAIEYRFMSVNMLMKFHEEITEILRVVAPEIKFC